MAVNYVTIKGYVRDGRLEVELPENVVDGEAEIKVVIETTDLPDDNEVLTHEEITELLQPEPLTGAEIIARGLTGGWKNLGITDSVAWVEEQKHKRQERHKWQQD